MSPTGKLLQELDMGFESYDARTRQYRLTSSRLPGLSAKVLQEKDVPVQVAIGNYDLGICGSDWIDELTVKYPASALVRLAGLGYGDGALYAATSAQTGPAELERLGSRSGDCRIVSEYPNLAESFALNLRMGRFRVFPVWGAAEAYPPEQADVTVLWAQNETDLSNRHLVPLTRLLDVGAFLVANRASLESKDLSPVLARLSARLAAGGADRFAEEGSARARRTPAEREPHAPASDWHSKEIKLALADGHQRPHTAEFLKRAGIDLEDYSREPLTRRPSACFDWLGIKVIRPQDMPLQVANGNFDLAITGQDWLREHLLRFPTSPVTELLGLGFGTVSIVVAVSQDMPARSIDELRSLVQEGRLSPLRVASEYTNTSDRYLRDNRVHPYRIIPTWGASEAFLPEDADVLIDNTETGTTLARHKLTVIDVIFRSSACLIGNSNTIDTPEKRDRVELLTGRLRRGIA